MAHTLKIDWPHFDEFFGSMQEKFAKVFEPLEACFEARDPKEGIIKLCSGSCRNLILLPDEFELSNAEISEKMPELAYRLHRALRSYVLTLFATDSPEKARTAARWYHSLEDLLPSAAFSYSVLSARLADETLSPEDHVQHFSSQLTGTQRRLGAHAASYDLILNVARNNSWPELLSPKDRPGIENSFPSLHHFFCRRVAHQHRELTASTNTGKSLNIFDHFDHFRSTKHMIQVLEVDLAVENDRASASNTIRDLVTGGIPDSSACSAYSSFQPTDFDLQLSLLGLKTATDALPHLDSDTSSDFNRYVTARLTGAYQRPHDTLYSLSIARQTRITADAHRDMSCDPLRLSEVPTAATTLHGTMSYNDKTLTLHLPSGSDKQLSLGASHGTDLFHRIAPMTGVYKFRGPHTDDPSALNRLRHYLLRQCKGDEEAQRCIKANLVNPKNNNDSGWLVNAFKRAE